jgi:hypothetical protein
MNMANFVSKISHMMKNNIFRDLTPCSPEGCCLHQGKIDNLLYPEDGGGIFLRYTGILLPDYTEPYLFKVTFLLLLPSSGQNRRSPLP